MRYCSLFTGVGGLDLAMDALGFEPVVQVENAEYPRSILDLRWPDVLKVGDIRTFDAQGYGLGHLESVDMMIGGPPCQPVSHAGLRRGDDDSRWLWGEALRVVEEAAPRIVFFENPMGIRTLGLDGILNRLDALGYGGAWEVVAAADVGAPHLRKRIFIMGVRGHKGWEGPTRPPGNRKVLWPSPNASGERPNEGNVRLLRQRVLAGDMTEDEAKGMLNGKSPFAAQGKVPALWPTPHGNTGNSKGGAFDGHGSELSQAVLVAEGLSDSERSAKRVPGLLPTPTTADGTGGPGTTPKREGGMNLRTYADRNPVADYEGGDTTYHGNKIWPPMADPNEPLGHDGSTAHERWPTPTSRDHNDTGDSIANGTVPVNGLLGRAVGPSVARGSLNPDWVEWLMGLPTGWTDVNKLGIPRMDTSWDREPSIPRIGLGIPNRSKRLTALGNGVVPQQAEFAFRRLRERIGW